MISNKVLISLEIAQFIPKCTGCFVDLAFTFFSCMLNTLFSQLQSSNLLVNTISLYHIVKCLLYYTAISKEIILFVNQASLRYSNLSDTHRLKSILRGNINYKSISC